MNGEFIDIMKYRKLTDNEIGAVLMRINYAMTFKAIGEDFGVTACRARQIYLKALQKLRHAEALKIWHELL